jgi:hypothetical protein
MLCIYVHIYTHSNRVTLYDFYLFALRKKNDNFLNEQVGTTDIRRYLK